jgi:endonuclease YncB( thermonuclease family)
MRGKVVGISDGDTLTALLADQRLIKVRVAFCDSPELHQAFGSRTKQAMSELVFAHDVTLRTHTIDRYGRLVAIVYVDGFDAGLEMIRQSYAWVFGDGHSALPKTSKPMASDLAFPIAVRPHRGSRVASMIYGAKCFCAWRSSNLASALPDW